MLLRKAADRVPLWITDASAMVKIIEPLPITKFLIGYFRILMFYRSKKKRNRSKICFFRFRTRSRDRTGTASLPLVFETSASTNSAIRAYSLSQSLTSYTSRLKPTVCENRKFLSLLSFYFCLIFQDRGAPPS
jgi:hypothetical protein